jgi:hypothetical protein
MRPEVLEEAQQRGPTARTTSLRYLYLMGRAYSGSTIFSVLMGQSEVIASEGEIIHGFVEGFENKRGVNRELFSESPFWTKVRHLFEERTGRDFVRAMGVLKRRSRFSRAIRYLFENPRSSAATEATHLAAALYDSIAAASERPIVLDCSKEVSNATYLLKGVKGLKVIHFVRHPHGVCDSYVKRIADEGRFDMFGKRTVVTGSYKRPLAMAAFAWTLQNAYCELLHLLHPGRVIRLHYEDVCTRPVSALEQLERWTGLSLEGSKAAATDRRAMQKTHALVANRSLWRNEMAFDPKLGQPRHLTAWDKALVTALTFPLMLAYGYFGFRRLPDLQAQDAGAERSA